MVCPYRRVGCRIDGHWRLKFVGSLSQISGRRSIDVFIELDLTATLTNRLPLVSLLECVEGYVGICMTGMLLVKYFVAKFVVGGDVFK